MYVVFYFIFLVPDSDLDPFQSILLFTAGVLLFIIVVGAVFILLWYLQTMLPIYAVCAVLFVIVIGVMEFVLWYLLSLLIAAIILLIVVFVIVIGAILIGLWYWLTLLLTHVVCAVLCFIVVGAIVISLWHWLSLLIAAVMLCGIDFVTVVAAGYCLWCLHRQREMQKEDQQERNDKNGTVSDQEKQKQIEAGGKESGRCIIVEYVTWYKTSPESNTREDMV